MVDLFSGVISFTMGCTDHRNKISYKNNWTSGGLRWAVSCVSHNGCCT